MCSLCNKEVVGRYITQDLQLLAMELMFEAKSKEEADHISESYLKLVDESALRK